MASSLQTWTSKKAFKMKLVLFSLCIFLAAFAFGQVIPEPGSCLTQTQVMFEYPAVKNAEKYQVVILQWDSIKKTTVPFLKQNDNTTASLVSDLKFGYEYRWKYLAFDKNQAILFNSREYVFYIKKNPLVDPNFQRVTINPANCNDSTNGFVIFNNCKIIVNRKGIPVYYVPEKPPLLSQGVTVRDLRVSPAGTVTVLTTKDAIELDLKGNILWTAPNDGKVSGEKTEFYHHAFCKMDNGNYMVLSNKHRKVEAPNDTIKAEIEFGTIIEYDSSGNVAWKWDSQDYFNSNDLFSFNNQAKATAVNPHSNSFDISKNGKYVFMGFRDISRIIKIEKATGKVISSYGLKMPSGDVKYANNYFRQQHSCTVLKEGNLAVFNNDSVSFPDITSSIIVFTQPENEKKPSKLVWEFDCKFDSLTDGKSRKTGSVVELPDQNLLVNMGTINRTIEITRDKKIVWDAFTEKWSLEDKKWGPYPQFSASYVSSLYPCYFTAEVTSHAIKKGKDRSATLKIFNEGTEEDSYEIIYEKGGIITKTSTAEILPDKWVSLDITAGADENIKIRIVSTHDQRRVRDLTLPVEMQGLTLNRSPETNSSLKF